MNLILIYEKHEIWPRIIKSMYNIIDDTGEYHGDYHEFDISGQRIWTKKYVKGKRIYKKEFMGRSTKTITQKWILGYKCVLEKQKYDNGMVNTICLHRKNKEKVDVKFLYYDTTSSILRMQYDDSYIIYYDKLDECVKQIIGIDPFIDTDINDRVLYLFNDAKGVEMLQISISDKMKLDIMKILI